MQNIITDYIITDRTQNREIPSSYSQIKFGNFSFFYSAPNLLALDMPQRNYYNK